MKIASAVLLLTGSLSSFAFADMPPDAPGNLSNPNLWARCMPGAEIGFPDFINVNKQSFATECINQEEFDFAMSRGVIVTCVGKYLVSACSLSLFSK